MPCVDGFVLAVPRSRLEEYRSFSRKAGEVWRDHGACAFVECIGDELPKSELEALPHALDPADDEVVVYSWIVYDSPEAREKIHAEAMADPRLKDAPPEFPIDARRLMETGRHALVEV
jgi:uncharacterized protein YbaA (DUF1428 family)